MENRRFHLNLIQEIVNRLASASFQVKGWSILLVSALLVLAAQASPVQLSLVVVIPVVGFWALDGYFLCQERYFRRLYDRVRKQEEDAIDFAMDISAFKRKGRLGRMRDWWSAASSVTLLLFFGMLAFLAASVSFALHYLES